MIKRFLAVIYLCMGFTCVANAEEALTTLVFATYPSERPSEELVKMEPIRDAIEKGLNTPIKKFRVDMRIFASYDEAVDATVSGKADFARLGPASYVHAKERNPELTLLAMESKDGTGYLTGYIYVADDSPIRELKDLRGRRFAFGEENSTAGRYLPQAALFEAGIKATDLAGFKYLGRHDKVAYAVGVGTFDAGASNEITYKKYEDGKNLRAIGTVKGRTHAWVARKNLPAAVRNQLKKTLLDFKSNELARIGRDGFLPVQDSDYDDVRRAMKKAESFLR